MLDRSPTGVSDAGMRPKHAVLSLLVLIFIVAFRLLSSHPSASLSTTAARNAPPSRVVGGASEVPVPQNCSPQVNQKLADLLARQQQSAVDNVMICGITISASRTQSGGPHGSHQVLPVVVNLPGLGTKLVEVVTNDELDGVVTAPKGAQVYAYGQAFFPSRGGFVAGIHDVHCATHRGADNGWVVVNGSRTPVNCPLR